ncbi:MAG TPA: DNA recombination protein RmuC, partial [Rhodanobacteraceae bacterium]|nr:DNA recombination protein RmuC [Rhodanobacteraceae bacterium]
AGRDAEVAQLVAARDNAVQALLRAEQTANESADELAAVRTRVVELSAERAHLAGRLERVASLETELAESRRESVRWREACQRAEQQATALGTRLNEQQMAMQEKIALLNQAREQFADSFKALAGDILEEKSKRFTEQNQSNLGLLLNPMREKLDGFHKLVTEVYDKESRERALLKHEIDTLKNLNQRISDDALNLTRALKGEASVQGAWGELILERLLEASGLQRGREYETQQALRDDDGGRPRPDVIVHLPEGRDLVIDAKVSLTAYERCCAAVDEAGRARFLRQHVDSMRGHVKGLSERRYSDLPGLDTQTFVLMFVPVEAAYIEAVRADSGLIEFAMKKRVMISTSSTLLPTLLTVASVWQHEKRNRNAFDIAERAGALYDKFVGFIDDMEALRGNLDGARRAFDAASSKLSSGRGNLVRQTEMLKSLGARTSKSLDPKLAERSAVDATGTPVHGVVSALRQHVEHGEPQDPDTDRPG